MDQIPQSVIDRLYESTEDDNWDAFLTTLQEYGHDVDGIEDWMIDKIQEVVATIRGFSKEYPGSASKIREMLIYYDNQY